VRRANQNGEKRRFTRENRARSPVGVVHSTARARSSGQDSGKGCAAGRPHGVFSRSCLTAEVPHGGARSGHRGSDGGAHGPNMTPRRSPVSVAHRGPRPTTQATFQTGNLAAGRSRKLTGGFRRIAKNFLEFVLLRGGSYGGVGERKRELGAAAGGRSPMTS
jgi:hypothetical protein